MHGAQRVFGELFSLLLLFSLVSFFWLFTLCAGGVALRHLPRHLEEVPDVFSGDGHTLRT